MFQLSLASPMKAARTRFAAIALLLLAGTIHAPPARATIAMTVRWASGPLIGPAGEALPPASTYEVWLTRQGQPESMVAVVPDTTYTLQATSGVTYVVRVRGVTALGLKSLLSPYSDPWQAPGATPAPEILAAGFGPARPNPFNARTVIANLVPEDLPGGALLALDIYDVRGRHIRSFAMSRLPGSHETVWNGDDLHGRPAPAGIYLARYVCGAYRSSLKLALVS